MRAPRMGVTTIAVLTALVTTACGNDDAPLAPDATRTSMWRRAGDSLVLIAAMDMPAGPAQSMIENPPKQLTLSKATQARLRALVERDTLARRLEAALMSTDTTASQLRAPAGAVIMPTRAEGQRTGWALEHPVVRDTQLTTTVMIEGDKPPVIMSTYGVQRAGALGMALMVARSLKSRRATPELSILVMEYGENTPLARFPRPITSRPAPSP